MSYRYASLLRPLGCWVFLTQDFSIEEPLESDVDPFRADWKAHNVLVTEFPLKKEEIQSLQLTDVQEMKNRKELYDKLLEMPLNVKAERYETMIKEELGDKIRDGKIKNEALLDKMITKYVNYVNGN